MQLTYRGKPIDRYDRERLLQIEEGLKLSAVDVDTDDPFEQPTVMDNLFRDIISLVSRVGDLENKVAFMTQEIQKLRTENAELVVRHVEQTVTHQIVQKVIEQTVTTAPQSVRATVETPAVKEISFEPRRKDPMMPKRVGNIVTLDARDICWGETWKRISSKQLTPDEQKWQTVYKQLRKEGFNVHDSLIVFGWGAELQKTMEIFHRIGITKILWVETHGKSKTAVLNMLSEIKTDVSRLCFIQLRKDPLKKGADSDMLELKRATVDRCNSQGIKYAADTNCPRYGVDCNLFASRMLTLFSSYVG